MGRGTLGETVAGVREPLGFSQVVQMMEFRFGWEQCGYRLCAHLGGFGSMAWTISFWVFFLEHCRLKSTTE